MFEIITGLLGGLAIFIYGMHRMAEGLQKVTGDKLKKVFNVITNIPIVGVAIGAGITAVVQSSSLTTVMAVGLVNATLMSLKQAVAVIMGANIGTTITAQIVAFKVTEYWAVVIAIGFIFYFFTKKKKIKNTGSIIFALGLLLLGMVTMSASMYPLRESEVFYNAILFVSEYKILGLLLGVAFTALVQSSSATTGLLIAMATAGVMPFEAALPILLGSNIGTCVTAILASIGTSVTAKRVAAAHVIFNLTGAIFFMIILPWFSDLVLMISPESVARQIANAHTMFNVITMLAFIPFINKYVRLMEKIIPEREKKLAKSVKYLDLNFIDSPQFAVDLALKELLHMASLARDNLKVAIEAILEKDEAKIAKVEEQEEMVDELDKEINRYLAKVSQSTMSESISVKHTGLLHAANDIERISDHAINITDEARELIDDNLYFSDIAKEGLTKLYKLTDKAFSNALISLEKEDMELAFSVDGDEQRIDDMEECLRQDHISRLQRGCCDPEAGVLFLDVLSNLERVGDHSCNIAHIAQGKI